MTLEVDFVPFAAAVGANVTTQSAYIAEPTTSSGFASGVAPSADCNKAWRQGTFVAAGVANFIANTLNANVLDNGNLSAFTTQLTDAITGNATAAATTVVDDALATFTLPFTSITGKIANAQMTQSAVTQYQAQLQIAGSQISGAISVSAQITATSFNVSSDLRLKENVEPITGALGRLDLYRGVTFRHKITGKVQASVIAQDFAKARPESVRLGQVEGLQEKRLEVDVMGTVAELLEALREERDARRALETRFAELEARLSGAH